MNYRLTWTDRIGRDCVLDIIDTASDSDGATTMLLPSSSPLVTSSSADKDFLLPLRSSTGRIGIVGTFADLLAFEPTPLRYTVQMERNGVLLWGGFLSPEVQTQSYSVVPSSLTINAIDFVAALAHTEVPTEDFSRRIGSIDYAFTVSGRVSIHKILAEAFARIASVMPSAKFVFEVGDFALQDIMAKTFLRDAFADFVDDGDGNERKTMGNYEAIVSAICRLFGWSLRQEGQKFVFDSPRARKVYSNAYTFASLYAGTFGAEANLPQSVVGLGDEQGRHTIDIEDGYRLIAVEAASEDGSGNVPSLDFERAKVIHERLDFAVTTRDGRCRAAYRVYDDTDTMQFVYMRPQAYGTQFTLSGVIRAANESAKNVCIPVSEDYWAGAGKDKGSADSIEDKRNYSWHTRLYLSVNDFANVGEAACARLVARKSFSAGDAEAIDIKFNAGIWLGSGLDEPLSPTKDKITQRGGTVGYLICSLRVGSLYWQGGDDAATRNGWASSRKTFPIRFGQKNAELQDVITNKTLQMPWEATGFSVMLPKDESGVFEFCIIGAVSAENKRYSRQYCVVEGLTLTACKAISADRDGVNVNRYRYAETADGYDKDMPTVSLPLHTGAGEYLGQIYTADGVAVSDMPITGSVSRQRPERALLAKMRPYLAPRCYLDIMQRIPLTMTTMHLYAGKLCSPVSISDADFAADTCKVTYLRHD